MNEALKQYIDTLTADLKGLGSEIARLYRNAMRSLVTLALLIVLVYSAISFVQTAPAWLFWGMALMVLIPLNFARWFWPQLLVGIQSLSTAVHSSVRTTAIQAVADAVNELHSHDLLVARLPRESQEHPSHRQ